MPKFPNRKIQQICASCHMYTLMFYLTYDSHGINMPKRRLFNLKNLGSWAGITTKKKKKNGEAEVADNSDKNMYTFSYTCSLTITNGR